MRFRNFIKTSHLVLFLRRSPGSAMTSIKTWEKQPRSGQWARTISQWCGGLPPSSPNSGLGTLRNKREKGRLSTESSSFSICSKQKPGGILPSTRVFVVLMAAVNTGHQDRTLKTWSREEWKRAANGLEGEERLGGSIPATLCVLYDWHFQFWTTVCPLIPYELHIPWFYFIWRFVSSLPFLKHRGMSDLTVIQYSAQNKPLRKSTALPVTSWKLV